MRKNLDSPVILRSPEICISSGLWNCTGTDALGAHAPSLNSVLVRNVRNTFPVFEVERSVDV